MTAPTSILDLEPITETDDGNALRLILAYGHKFRRVADMHKWLTWDGHALGYRPRRPRDPGSRPRMCPVTPRRQARRDTSNATRCQQPVSRAPFGLPCPIRASASLQQTSIHIPN